MRFSSLWIPELALGALGLALAVLLAVPWGQRREPKAAAGREAAAPASEVQPDPTPAQVPSPRQLAALFGWREARAAAAPRAAAAAPAAQEAPWIQPMGYVVEQNGTRSYIFKDARTRGVFSLKAGGSSKGWRLMEVREKDFLLEFDGKPYIIRRKP